jgi:hypothetical protein
MRSLLQLSCSPKGNVSLTLSHFIYLTFSHLSPLSCVPISASKAPRRSVPLSWTPLSTKVVCPTRLGPTIHSNQEISLIS